MSEILISLVHHNTTGVFESLVEKKRRVIDIRPDWYKTCTHIYLAIGKTLCKCETVKVYDHR